MIELPRIEHNRPPKKIAHKYRNRYRGKYEGSDYKKWFKDHPEPTNQPPFVGFTYRFDQPTAEDTMRVRRYGNLFYVDVLREFLFFKWWSEYEFFTSERQAFEFIKARKEYEPPTTEIIY